MGILLHCPFINAIFIYLSMIMITWKAHFFKASLLFLMLGVFSLPIGTLAAGTETEFPPSLPRGVIPGFPLLIPPPAAAQWIILDEHNQKIHVFESDSLAPWKAEQWFVRSDGHEWIVDNQLNALTPVHYEQLDRIGEDLVLFRENGKSGVMGSGGTKILEARYDVIRQLDGILLAGKSVQYGFRWKLFDQQGRELSPYLWEQIGRQQTNGLIPVRRNGFWGFIDAQGRQPVECVYDSLGTFVGNRVGVTFKGLHGIIDDKDQWVVKPGKELLTPLNDRLYISENDELVTIRNYQTGTIYFTNNPISMKKGYFVEQLSDGTYWKINYSGRIINSQENLSQYQEIRLPSEGFIAVKIHGRYGFIDEQDRLRIANRYDDVQDYHEGLAAFKLMNRWGFINKLEDIVIQPMYDEAGNFENGISIVRRGDKYGAINREGKEIVSLSYDAIERQPNGRFIITREGKKGLVSAEGRVIVFPRFEEIRDLPEGQVIVRILGKYGVISRAGDDLIPPIYDQITFDPFNRYYLAMKKK